MIGYLVKGSRDEFLMVIRSEDLEVIRSIVQRLGKMREKHVQEVVKELEFSLERIDRERN
jgi:hypothetical protein